MNQNHSLNARASARKRASRDDLKTFGRSKNQPGFDARALQNISFRSARRTFDALRIRCSCRSLQNGLEGWRDNAAPRPEMIFSAISSHFSRLSCRQSPRVIANSECRAPKAGGPEMASGLTPGAPDPDHRANCGRVYMIEVKTVQGRMSPAQNDFRLWCVAAGVPHGVARSVDDVQGLLALGASRRGRRRHERYRRAGLYRGHSCGR